MSDINKLVSSQRSVDKQLERAKRQAILMAIIEAAKTNMTFEQLAEKMRENHWIAARWPSYSATTANKDFNAVMGMVRDDVKTLAMPYFIRQVELIDGAIEQLQEFVGDDQLDYKLRIDAINAMRGYIDQSLKIFGNYAPKEMHIKKAEVQFNLDAYNEMKKEFQKNLPEGDIVDGEFE